MEPLICSAITGREVLRFVYRGGIRVVEPFCFGRSAAGHPLLRAYQIGGFSESGQTTGWKLFRVQEISELVVDREVRPRYNPVDPAMVEIFCRA